MKPLILVLGASENPERYSYKAANLLLKHGYDVALVGNKAGHVFDHDIKTPQEPSVKTLQPRVVTLYVGPKNQKDYFDQILAWKPKTVVFNPGTENPELQAFLKQHRINYTEACTLVMLGNGLFGGLV